MAIAGLLPDLNVGPDGRPLIEVGSLIDYGHAVEMAGTACMYEATLLITVDDRQDRTVHQVTASVGGPDRGTWSVSIPAPQRPVRISVGADNPGEGNVLRRDMVVVTLT